MKFHKSGRYPVAGRYQEEPDARMDLAIELWRSLTDGSL
jgi:hypothetical protein